MRVVVDDGTEVAYMFMSEGKSHRELPKTYRTDSLRVYENGWKEKVGEGGFCVHWGRAAVPEVVIYTS